jgi:signal transduction histidine kinase
MENKNYIRLRDQIKSITKRQFLIISTTLFILITPLIFWSISNFYEKSNKYLIESNLSYIHYLLTVGDVIELQNHFNSLTKKSGLKRLALLDSSSQKVLLTSENEAISSFYNVSRSLSIPIEEQNVHFSLNYSYPYPIEETFVYVIIAQVILLVFGLVTTNLLRRTSRLVENSFLYLTDLFYKFKINGLNTHQLQTREDLPLEVNHIIEVLNENINKLRHSEELKLKLIQTQTYNTIAKQVAHDIRSPLSSLSIIANNIKSLSSRESELLNISVQRINEIAEDLLAQERKQRLKYEELQGIQAENIQAINNHDKAVMINDILKDVIKEKKLEYSTREDIHLLEYFDEVSTDIKTKIDPKEFKRVISNLINNSIEAIPDGKKGIVSITVSRDNDKLLLELRDNGKGIKQDLIEKVFQPGFSFGKENGNGLGLSYAKRTIESFNGRLNIFSKPEVGTTIRIYLPFFT